MSTKGKRVLIAEIAWGVAAISGTTFSAWLSGLVALYFFLDWGFSPIED